MKSYKSDFPIFDRKVNGEPLVYLDHAATSQKPAVVLEAYQNFYRQFNANVHRGIHTLSQEATQLMEDSREAVRAFIHAKHTHEIIFTRGATEGINLVAYSIEPLVQEGDEIVVSQLEHHSNIVPWQFLCERKGLKLRVIPLKKDSLEWDMEATKQIINEKTKIVAVNHISNALGIENPMHEIISLAKSVGAIVLIDACQSASHSPIDVQTWDCDFLVFSGHKMYAPTGVGILYGKQQLLEQMRPYHGGGEMIARVTFEKTTYADLPFKFEAGTPNFAGNTALKYAIEYIQSIGWANILAHENKITEVATEKLLELDFLEIYALNATKRVGAISMNFKNKQVLASDVGFILDKMGIAVRTGHHCCQPLMDYLGVNGSLRASFGIYTDEEDVDKLITGLNKAAQMLC